MLKKLELVDPESCLNKAKDDEFVFVLLARDPVAPKLVRDWAARRIAAGLNRPDDDQITNALYAADVMEAQNPPPTPPGQPIDHVWLDMIGKFNPAFAWYATTDAYGKVSIALEWGVTGMPTYCCRILVAPGTTREDATALAAAINHPFRTE